MIDTFTEAVIATVPLGSAPNSVAVDSANGDIYVTDTNTELDGSNVTIVAPASCPDESVLASVNVTPTLTYIYLAGGTATFTAEPTCEPTACPGTVTYRWSVANSNVSIEATTANPVTVKAGSVSGDDAIYVNASLDGFTVGGNPAFVLVVISGGGGGGGGSGTGTLTGVDLSPGSASVAFNATGSFAATAVCSGSCSGTATFSWSLSSSSLGSLSTTSGDDTTFTAAATAGSVELTVSASLASVTESAHAAITVSKTGSSSTSSKLGLLGLPGNDGIAIVAVAVVAVGAAAGGVLWLKGRPKVPSPPPPPPPV